MKMVRKGRATMTKTKKLKNKKSTTANKMLMLDVMGDALV